ncbi:MAG: hypothetical protein K6E83_04640 [Clostridium sp.]|nr:hypothetical protein [Clostridium sp.]
MGYLSTPVKIPAVPGKITFRKRNETTYVLVEIGRTYNSARQNTNPQRKIIGKQIRNVPTMMLPNENYVQFFGEGEMNMTEAEKKAAKNYESVRCEFRMLASLFDQLYFEFQILAHRSPHMVVNGYKVRRINKVLEPLKALMADEPYAGFLERIEEPEVIRAEDGAEKQAGLNYSDVAILLTQYKGAMTRFSADCL